MTENIRISLTARLEIPKEHFDDPNKIDKWPVTMPSGSTAMFMRISEWKD
jgi:hypothetical protein